LALPKIFWVDESYYSACPRLVESASDEKGDLVGFVLPVF